MHEYKKIKIMNIYSTIHCRVSSLSYTSNVKTILPQSWFLLIHSISLLLLKRSLTVTISASKIFCSHMAVSVGTMQLTLSIPIMQVPTSVTII